MDLQLYFLLSFCLQPYFVEANVLVIYHDKVLERVLREFNITDPTEKEILFARKIVDERIENERYRKEMEDYQESLRKEKEDLQRTAQNLSAIISEKDRELFKVEASRDFHAEVSSVTFIQDTMDTFKRKIPERYCGHPLEDANSIKNVQRNFLYYRYSHWVPNSGNV